MSGDKPPEWSQRPYTSQNRRFGKHLKLWDKIGVFSLGDSLTKGVLCH